MSNVAKPSRANPSQALRENDLITGKECVAIVRYGIEQATTPLYAEITLLRKRLDVLETPWYVRVTKWVLRA